MMIEAALVGAVLFCGPLLMGILLILVLKATL